MIRFDRPAAPALVRTALPLSGESFRPRGGSRLFWPSLALLVWVSCLNVRAAEGIREPAVAGSFYPGSPDELRAAIHSFLNKAPVVTHKAPVALVAPHAGYPFAGQIIADAFRQAQDHSYDLVVVLGTNHTVPGFDRASVYVGEGYRTPLGIAPIDRKLAESLVADFEAFVFDKAAHRREHSVEVELPFIQTLFPDAKILPIIVGSSRPDLCRQVAANLVDRLRGRKVLFVASSDLSHYPPYDVAREVDATILQKIVDMDPTAFSAEARREVGHRSGLVTRACGEAPILVAMEVARKLGVEHGTLVDYANSGDSPLGERNRVVGYGAVVMVPEHGDNGVEDVLSPKTATPLTLTAAQKKYLLQIARDSIRQYLATQGAPVPNDPDGKLSFPSGVFVTLREHGRLRGCVGRLDSDLPVIRGVVRYALYAAFGDSRFQPVRLEEVPDLNIEISILTPLERVEDVKEIQLGRDGVFLEKDGHSATFLPQVADEQHWNRNQMLQQLCVKAGLPGECWRTGATFDTYQAIVFGEPEQNPGRQP